jgi:hypothetical protein
MISVRARGAVAGAAMAALFAALLSVFPLRAFEARLSAALRSRGPVASSFDPAYQEFLREVERAVPADATVALEVPRGELYVYEAAYRLAPRRVVFRADDTSAALVAIYAGVSAPPPAGRGTEAKALGHGLLYRR